MTFAQLGVTDDVLALVASLALAGMGLATAPPITTVLGDISPPLTGAASGVLTTAR